MLHTIGGSGRVEVTSDKVYLIIPKRTLLIERLFGAVVSAGMLFVFVIACLDARTILGQIGMGLWSVTWLFLSCHFILAREHSEIDPVNRTLVKKLQIGKIVYKKTILTWPSKYSFKYDFVSRGSRGHSFKLWQDKIWLEAFAYESKKRIKLVRFYDPETALDFQKVFNRAFPNNRIKEWNDSYPSRNKFSNYFSFLRDV